MATPSPNDLTRQQLDELDALLQRMLAIPAAVPEPLPAAQVELPDPPTGWRADRPAAAPAVPTPHLAAVAAAVPEPAAAVARVNPFSFVPTPEEPIEPPEQVAAPSRLFGPPTPETGVPPSAPESAAVTWAPVQKTLAAAPTPADPGPIDLKAVPAGPAATSKPATMPETKQGASGVPAWLWPVFGMNWLIEKGLSLFGPPGMALATPAMKYMLGGVGILLMVGAAVWTARGMGWMKLPMP
jgi:hypothetical protein